MQFQPSNGLRGRVDRLLGGLLDKIKS